MNQNSSDFVPWNGDYDKTFYDVLLPTGEIVKHCWPNADFMVEIMNDERQWSKQDGIKVRLSPDHPMDD